MNQSSSSPQSQDKKHELIACAGYIGSVGLLETIKRVVGALREENPNLIYVCDPVLGDEGRLYLPVEMVGLYKSEILPLATVITPNQFEAEQLTGAPVNTEQEALQACHALLGKGPKTVVKTSCSMVFCPPNPFFGNLFGKIIPRFST